MRLREQAPLVFTFVLVASALLLLVNRLERPLRAAGSALDFHESQVNSDMSLAFTEIAKSAANSPFAISIPPPNGNVNHKIDKKHRTFTLPTGDSRVILAKLPDATIPYVLRIRSMCNCLGFSKSIFAPRGVFLDSEFRQTGELADTQFRRAEERSGWQLKTEIEIGSERKKDTYLLLFTDAKRVGTSLGGFSDSNAQVRVTNWPVGGAEYGTIKFETFLPKK